MKMSNMVRFSPARQNGPVVVRKLINTKTLLAAVEQEPGLSGAAYAYRLNPNPTPSELMNAVARLSGMTKTKKPKIKRTKLDGKYRFYPINYKLLTGAPIRPIETLTPSKAEIIPVHSLTPPPGTERRATGYAIRLGDWCFRQRPQEVCRMAQG